MNLSVPQWSDRSDVATKKKIKCPCMTQKEKFLIDSHGH